MMKIKEIVKKISKRNLILSFIMILLIAICIVVVILDCTYWEYNSFKWAIQVINFLKKNKPVNMTYEGALSILQSSVGMLMTIISLFLNTNINVIQRRQLNAYGIPRHDLISSKNHSVYKVMNYWNYIAPLFMLICINLSFCLSGYLLFFLSYIILLSKYYFYEKSFDKDRDQDNVVKKLKECVENFENDEEYVWEYQMLVDRIGKNVVKDGNWKEIDILFKNLRDKIKEMEHRKKYLATMIFYRSIYMKEKSGEKMAVQTFKNYLIDVEKRNSADNSILDKEWSILWGFFRVLFETIEEEALIDFISWILDSKTRGRIINDKEHVSLSEQVLVMEHEMCLIGLEQSFKKRNISKQEFSEQLKMLWKVGEKIFLYNNEKKYLIDCQRYTEKIIFLEYELKEKEISEIENIKFNLKEDYNMGSRKTYIANIIQM